MKPDGHCGSAEIALLMGVQGVVRALKEEEGSHPPEDQVGPENRQQLQVLWVE